MGDDFKKDLEEIKNRLDTAERSLIRIDAAAQAQSEAAKLSARALIAEQQSSLTTEVERLRWEFRHFERLGRLAAIVFAGCGLVLATFGFRSVTGAMEASRVAIRTKMDAQTDALYDLYRAFALQASEAYRESIPYLKNYLDKTPFDETALAALFQAYIQAGDWNGATQTYKNIKKDPRFQGLHRALTFSNIGASLLPMAANDPELLREASELLEKGLNAVHPDDLNLQKWLHINGFVAASVRKDRKAALYHIDQLNRMPKDIHVVPWPDMGSWAPLVTLHARDPVAYGIAQQQWARLAGRYGRK